MADACNLVTDGDNGTGPLAGELGLDERQGLRIESIRLANNDFISTTIRTHETEVQR